MHEKQHLRGSYYYTRLIIMFFGYMLSKIVEGVLDVLVKSYERKGTA